MADLEMEVMDAGPARAAALLKPYLKHNDARLAPLIAEVLAKGERIPVGLRNDLLDAILKIANTDVFEPILPALESDDMELVRRVVHVIAATKHPKAVKTFIQLYESRNDDRLRREIVVALGELGDRSALKFLKGLVGAAKQDELRQEIAITMAMLGARSALKPMLEFYADLRKNVYEIVIHLNWLSYADPRKYRLSVRDVKRMKKQIERAEKAFRVACRHIPGYVIDLLQQAERPDELDIFYAHLRACPQRAARKGSDPRAPYQRGHRFGRDEATGPRKQRRPALR